MPGNRTSRVSVAFVILLVGLIIGCSSRPSDEAITRDIENKIAADPQTKGSGIKVVTKDGKVTLRGKATTQAAQQKAEQFARLEPGVVKIEDVTSVEPKPMPPPTAAVESAKALQTVAPRPVQRPKPQLLVLPAGTILTVRLGTPLSSKASQSGQSFSATLAQPVNVGGKNLIPAGAPATGSVVAAKAKGKFKGEAQLDLTLTSIMVSGQTYPIQTQVLENRAKGKGKRTAVTTGGGAAGGALIGGIAGGGKGAGIGALVGAGAGLVGGAMTGNKQIELPAEAALSFQLSAPLTVKRTAE